MDCFNAVSNTVHVGLLGLADWLYGCAHRKTAFPITLRPGVGVEGPHSKQPETYIVCLDCGRHLGYDWTTMRLTRRQPARKAPASASLPALSEANRGSR